MKLKIVLCSMVGFSLVASHPKILTVRSITDNARLGISNEQVTMLNREQIEELLGFNSFCNSQEQAKISNILALQTVTREDIVACLHEVMDHGDIKPVHPRCSAMATTLFEIAKIYEHNGLSLK